MSPNNQQQQQQRSARPGVITYQYPGNPEASYLSAIIPKAGMIRLKNDDNDKYMDCYVYRARADKNDTNYYALTEPPKNKGTILPEEFANADISSYYDMNDTGTSIILTAKTQNGQYTKIFVPDATVKKWIQL